MHKYTHKKYTQIRTYTQIQHILVIPTGRMCRAEEIAYLVSYLCSEEASYITGSFTLMDGGIRDHSVSLTPMMRDVQQRRASKTHDGVEWLKALDDKEHQERTSSEVTRSKFALQ